MSQNQSNKTHKRSFKAKVSPEEYQLLLDLRKRSSAQNPPKVSMTFGERVADRFAVIMGSWKFIIIQSIFLAIWVTLNIVAFIKHWDSYPFILLNLMLSFQAAYAAPIIMMSHGCAHSLASYADAGSLARTVNQRSTDKMPNMITKLILNQN